MPSCEYCGCKIGRHAREDLADGSTIFVCGHPECFVQLEDAQEASALERDADIETIGDDVAYGLENVGCK